MTREGLRGVMAGRRPVTTPGVGHGWRWPARALGGTGKGAGPV